METKNIELITKMVIDAINKTEDKGEGFLVPIGVSARHIHLTQEHVEALFGPGYQLTKKKELMGGQIASNETVTIVGLKLRAIENVSLIGPVRKASQVEVSATDAIKLGMNVPVREFMVPPIWMYWLPLFPPPPRMLSIGFTTVLSIHTQKPQTNAPKR